MTVKIQCKFDAMVPVSEMQPHPKNRNVHPMEQVDRLAKMIAYQGVRAPIVVSNRSGYMVKGHGTLLAEIKAGMTEVPVVYQDFDSEEQEYAFVQGDNAIAEWADLDLSGINADLADLGPDFDADMLGLREFVVEPADKEPKASKNKNDAPQFLVTVICENENQMAELFEEFKGRGLECKLIT